MSSELKRDFLVAARRAIQLHPEWFADAVLAMQDGLMSALEDERQKTANLAYGFVTVALAAPKQTERNKNAIQLGLQTLARFFEGSVSAERIKQWIEEASDETAD